MGKRKHVVYDGSALSYRKHNPFANEDITDILNSNKRIIMAPGVTSVDMFTLVSPIEATLTPDELRYKRMNEMYESMLNMHGKVTMSEIPVGFKRTRDE